MARQENMLKWLWVTFVVIFLDQITKWMADAQINYSTSIIKIDGVAKELVTQVEVIPVIPHLNWSFAYNYGAAFNFLGDQGGWQRWFFVILSAVVSVVILIWLARLKKGETSLAIGLSFILGGAIGNLIDRFLHGRVIDFIDVYADWDVFFLSNGHFATFNVADIAINIGAAILLLTILFTNEDEPKKKT